MIECLTETVVLQGVFAFLLTNLLHLAVHISVEADALNLVFPFAGFKKVESGQSVLKEPQAR